MLSSRSDGAGHGLEPSCRRRAGGIQRLSAVPGAGGRHPETEELELASPSGSVRELAGPVGPYHTVVFPTSRSLGPDHDC